MSQYPLHQPPHYTQRPLTTQTKTYNDMTRSMIADLSNNHNLGTPSRTARLSEFLPQDIYPEEMVEASPMIFTSRKNRKYSQAVFNHELMQNVNKSKLSQSKIVEPLRFGDKQKVKISKAHQQINKSVLDKSELATQSPQSDSGYNNGSHLMFGSSRIDKNQFGSPKLNFRTGIKEGENKEDSTYKNRTLESSNIHSKQMSKNPQEKTHTNLLKYKTPMIKPKTDDGSNFKEKSFSHKSGIHSQTSTPSASTPLQSNSCKKSQTFSASNMTIFFKKSNEDKSQGSSPVNKAKQVESKDGSNSNLTFNQSLRSSVNNLTKEDFYIGKRLGKGKFGEVFLVKHKEIGFLCAMKVISKSVIQSQQIQNQLCSQIKIQLYLSHPNIASLYGIFSDKQNIYLLMEPCLDGQLFHLIKKQKRIPEKQTSVLVKQICLAVDYMQAEKIIHRDLKPQNILLSQGIIKVCDFGWAAFHNDQFRDTFCGTPLYLSPELLSQDYYNDKVDNWAIGILTYQMLYGRIPFKISTKEQLQKILFEEIVFPEFVQTSDNAKNFVLLILQRNPSQRADIQSCLCHPFFTSH